MFAVRPIRAVAIVAVLLAPTLLAQSPDQPRYLLPPPQIVATFDKPPLPQVIVSPTRQQLAVTMRKGNPTLAELARPTLRLAGSYALFHSSNYGGMRRPTTAACSR